MGAGGTLNNPGPLGASSLCHWASLRPQWELSGRQGVRVTQGARQPLMVLEEVQSQRRRKQEHGGSVAAVGPGACVSSHLPTGQGLLQTSPSACSCGMSSEDSQQSLLGEGRRLNFSCLPKCYCLYGLWKSVLWSALFVH